MSFFRATSVILFILDSIAQGQPLSFEHYNSEHGLSQNTILSIAQDSDGFLWLGTEDGLNRFDGYEFEVFQSSEEDSTGIRNDQVWSLLADADGRIWCGHTKGLSYFDPSRGRFRNVLKDDDLVITSLHKDKESGMLWAGTGGKGLVTLDRSGKILRYLNKTPALPPYDSISWGLVTNYILSTYSTGGSQWIGTRGGGLFNFESGKFVRPRIPSGFQDFFLKNDIWSILADSAGTLFFGTGKGLGIFSADLGQGKVVTETEGLSFNRIAGLAFYGEKLLITTYGGGLNIYDLKTGKITPYRHEPRDMGSVSSDLTFSLLVDDRKNLWIGTWANGLNKVNRNRFYFNSYSLGEPGTGKYVSGFAQSGSSVLISTYSLGIFSSPDGESKNLAPTAVPLTEKQRTFITRMYGGREMIWLATEGNGIGYFSRRDALPSVAYYKKIPGNDASINNHLITCVVEDDEFVWAGTRGSGLKRISKGIPYGSPGSVRHFNHANDSTGVSGTFVTALGFDHSGTLWIGTNNGLNKMKSSGNLVSFEKVGSHTITTLHFGKKVWVGCDNGLFMLNGKVLEKVMDGYINFIAEVGSDVWVSTNHGIVRRDAKGTMFRYTHVDGLQGNEFNVDAGLLSSSGKLYLGGVNGFTVFDPHAIRPLDFPARVSASFNTGQDEAGYDGTGPVKLKHDRNAFEFEFAALDFTNPEATTYEYILEGFDPGWRQAPSGRRVASYTNMDAGTYSFKVRANTNDTVLSESKGISIEVLPAPWATWWAYSLYVLVFILFTSLILREIIERERLRVSLRMERLELEKAQAVEKMRSALFTNITHEFRTPLTLILGPLKQLQGENSLSAAQRDHLEKADRNARKLSVMINQLLDISKLEAGAMPVEKRPVEIYPFLCVTAQSFDPIAAQKGLRYSIDVQHTQAIVTTDDDKLEKIINNLLSNAIKFTPAGGTVAFAASSFATAAGIKLSIRVSDSGPGIATDELPRIFERFYRGESMQHAEGTGIGLALVRELATLMGAEITVQSEPGKGTTFELHLSLDLLPGKSVVAPAPAIQHETTDGEDPEEESMPHGVTVLVAEDNDDLREYIRGCLAKKYHVLTASNGKEAWDATYDNVPDMIVSDLMMPVMDGVEFCKEVKASQLTAHIPFILVTAKADDATKLNGLQHGADDYLVKPFDTDELLFKVNNWLKTQASLQQRIRKELLQSPSRPDVLSADEVFLHKLKGIIEKKMAEPQLTVESLSREIALSRVQLYRKVLGLTGISVNELIRTMRLRRAAHLMDEKWGSVSEIAYEVGFNNLSYFAKCFKSEFGNTPSEYLASQG